MQREGDDKFAPVACPAAGRANGPSVQLDQLPCDGKAYSHPARGWPTCGDEAIEEPRQETRGNPAARVGDADLCPVGRLNQADGQGTIRRSELDCVQEQIREHLLQAHPVAIEPYGMPRQFKLKALMFRDKLRPDRFGRFLYDLAQVQPLDSQLLRIQLQACRLVEVVNQARESLELPLENCPCALARGVAFRRPGRLFQNEERRLRGGERLAHLVSHLGEHLYNRLIGFLVFVLPAPPNPAGGSSER